LSRTATIAALGVLLGVAGLVVYRSVQAGAVRPALPAAGDDFLNAVYRVENILYEAVGSRARMSARGLALLQEHEGFSPTPYRDFEGNWTIGYGHLIRAGESFTSLTPEQALELLAADVREAEDAVNAVVSVPLTQSQFDALVSFAFNVGAGAFRGSTLVKRLNAGEYAAVPEELQRWKFITQNGQKVESSILAKRRVAESALFLA